MKIKALKELIAQLPDEEEIFIVITDKCDINEYIWNNFEDGEKQPAITDAEMEYLVQGMNNDEGLWSEINELTGFHMDKLEKARKSEEAK